jgi:outer membrane receptor for ferrienterochelin and colicin
LFKYLLFTILFIQAFRLGAHDAHLETIKVKGRLDQALPKNRIKKDSIDRTEVINQHHIEKKQAITLAQAVDNEVGVDTQTSCGNCGSKRVTLNGLRGEHTTVLVDGIPLHSAVSSFYGMDAVPVVGIDSIEIIRGAGASLSSPEAIGGVINIETVNATADSSSFNATLGTVGMRDLQYLTTKLLNQGRQSIVVGAQASAQAHFDEDKNNVAENAAMKNYGGFLKFKHKFTSKTDFMLRLSWQSLEQLGGTTTGFKPSTYASVMASETDFVGGDVRNSFIGAPEKITDLIEIERKEVASTLTYHLSDDTNIKLTSALALQAQDSIYMHGYDYANNDYLNFNDIRLNHFLGAKHFLTFGLDNKNHSFKSDSVKLYDDKKLKRDNFKHHTFGLYLQDEWFVNDQLEISTSLRLDKITVNWTDYQDKDKEIDDWVFAPRFKGVYRASELYTFRFNTGVGYRSPLTLFESQHGSTHDGFIIGINKVEKALGVGASLDYTPKDYYVSLSSNLTRVKNLAFAEETSINHDPLLFKNMARASNIWANDVTYGFDPSHDWHLSLTYERFDFPDRYAMALPVAAIESRARIQSDFHYKNFEFLTTINYTFARDLARYGYNTHYNTYDGSNVTNQKRQRSPGFLTLDLLINYQFKSDFKFSFGVLNLTDYTQTRAGDSPLTWDKHGNHAHLDNFHIWGPLRGRQLYARAQVNF